MTRGLRTAEERVPTGDGLTLFVRSWRPEGPARAVVAIVHGFNSHSGEYAWAASQLVSAGLAVYAPDLRGRGKSDGERFFVNSFGDWVNDVAKVVSLATSREPGLAGAGNCQRAARAISTSVVTVRQLRAVAATPRSRSTRPASLEAPNPFCV